MNQWMGSESPDDTLDGLRQFLPEVEQQLRNEIQPELERQFEKIMQEQLGKIERQAEGEFEAALEVLQSEMGVLKYQKLSQLEAELSDLKSQKEERDRVRLAQAQQRFIQEHFDDRVLVHPAMQQLEHGLQSEIAEQMGGRYESVREKRVKQLKVRLQSRELKERVEMDKSIRSEIYSKSGLDELKQEIGRFKISLASLKSKYNLKITKITSQIKELGRKCQETGYSNSGQLIQELQREISELKMQVQANYNNQKETSQEDSSFYFNQRGNNFSLADNHTKNTFFQPTTNHQSGNKYIEGAQYINEDIDIDSEDSLDEMTSSERKAQEQIPPPPNSREQMLKRLLVEEGSENEERQFEDRDEVYLEMPMKSLLQFNVAKMLREQWQEDSFDRYLSLRSAKENNMNTQNQTQNNFQTLYGEHLKRLNRDSKVPKMKRLTEKAKQQISLNFVSQRHKNMDSYF